jgi:hypothetical protein
VSYDVLHADGTPCLHDPEVTEIAGQDIVVLTGGRLDRCTGAVWQIVRPGDRDDEVIAPLRVISVDRNERKCRLTCTGCRS